ncbi:MAG: ferrous iron transport protein A [Clostridia bacterium]|nr:ferrous iron transport protein A [Clostridia bacterium]
MKNCKLYELPKGKKGTIVNVIWEKNISRRLMELGFVKGTTVEMLFSSPKENLFIVRLIDFEIEIRKNALKLIEVEYE